MENRYYFPQSYTTKTRLFNGLIDLRHAIDAGLLALLGYIICRLLPIPRGIDGLSYYTFVCVPLALIGFHGLWGDAISTTLYHAILWSRHKKPYIYSNSNQAYPFSVWDVYADRKSFRDRIAGAYQNYQQKHAVADLSYTIGTDFEFAEDPDQASLKFEYKRRMRAEAPQQGAEDTKAEPGTQDVKTVNDSHSAAERSTEAPSSINILDALENM